MGHHSIRSLLALELGRFFLLHLQTELAKVRPGSNDSATPGHTEQTEPAFHDSTTRMMADLHAALPELKQAPPAPYNMWRRWWDSMRQGRAYADMTFRLYNQAFYYRLLDIRDGTAASREKMESVFTGILNQARQRSRSMTFEVMYTGESRFYEQCRKVVRECASLQGREELAWRIVLRQHQVISRASYRFFDAEMKQLLKRSDEMLKIVLPDPIAEELREHGQVQPVHRESASVMFTDIVGFTRIAETLPPADLLRELDRCFSHFDAIMKLNRLEKIKTIGDSYMCAGGVLEENITHAVDAALCALRIQEFMRKYRKNRERRNLPYWQLRVGIHSGPVIAGIIGTQRFGYDIWGDTVNLASRMEAAGEAGRINISQSVNDRIADFFITEPRGRLPVKNKGDVDMFFLNGIRPELSLFGNGLIPNRSFQKQYARLRRSPVD
ncbi:MAG: adenylate/guanylate cyclase domain-containing protein [Leptospiraceae bacterium]|nr:adenylate/guanylate cyclase domain-containing protein [Leptospiraceae bacterium]MCB1315480.1 adenylate/guanylate cyclase domain-containing protein [Leptospiraceae bacterium]